MRKDAFIETYCVATLRTAVAQALEAGDGQPAIVLVFGEPGTGKTKAARSLYAGTKKEALYLRALEGMTEHDFLQDLCFEIMGERPHGRARCKREILRALDGAPRVFYIDEADRLDMRLIEHLRDIHDITNSPVALIGEMGLPVKLRARERINDRIPEAFRVHFKDITPQDIMLFALEAANLQLSPEAAATVHSETKGNFRRVHNAVLLLERAANVTETNEVNGQLCRETLSIKSKGGR